MNKTIKLLQFIWLAVAVIAVLLGFHALATKGFEDAIYFFVITLVSALMFFLNKRRYASALKKELEK